LSALSHRDIGVGPDPLSNAGIIIEYRHSTTLKCAVFSITGSYAEFVLIPTFLLLRLFPRGKAASSVFRVYGVKPSEAFCIVLTLPRHFFPPCRYKERFTLVVGPPDILRNRIDQCTVTFLAFAKRFFVLSILDRDAGNVHCDLRQPLL